MPCVAQFGIIDRFETDKNYSKYEPEKYNCVAIDDNYLSDWHHDLAIIKSYFHSFNRPEFGLARWEITLIPPESVGQLFSIVSKDKRSKTREELIDLLAVLQKAFVERKYVIHFGV